MPPPPPTPSPASEWGIQVEGTRTRLWGRGWGGANSDEGTDNLVLSILIPSLWIITVSVSNLSSYFRVAKGSREKKTFKPENVYIDYAGIVFVESEQLYTSSFQ